jgi:hypothetical protein
MNGIASVEREIVNGVALICRILLIGLLLGTAVIFARLFGRGGAIAFANGSINVPANYAWILFMVLTLGHRLYSWHLVRNILLFWESCSTVDGGKHVFNEIRSRPNMFVFGLIPRVRTKRRWKVTVYIMEQSDPSTIFSHFALLVFLVAMFPWYITSYGDLRWSKGWALWLPIIAALIIAERNWHYGGYWVIALSQLTVEKDQADMLILLKQRQNLIRQKRLAEKNSGAHKWKRFRRRSGG